jgi:hypothetical protein
MTETIITKSVANKVTITITAYKLWTNFMSTWTEVAWDQQDIGVGIIQQIAVTLMKDTLVDDEVRQLFRDCHTVFLLDDAMTLVDQPDTLVEVVVVKGDQKIVVKHHDINF